MRLIDYNDEMGRGTLGAGGVDGRYGGAYPCGSVNLHSWDAENELITRRIKCRSYRRAVRLLRLHLKGYNV